MVMMMVMDNFIQKISNWKLSHCITYIRYKYKTQIKLLDLDKFDNEERTEFICTFETYTLILFCS
jgi:hypothetical protein